MTERILHPPLPDYPLTRQQLQTWRPLLTAKTAAILLCLVGIVLIAIGFPLHFVLKSQFYTAIPYSSTCLNTTCSISVTIPSPLTGTVELGYQLTHFYQNHRRFGLSRIDSQLRGEYVDFSGMGNCYPYRSVNDSSDPTHWYLPCGMFPRSVFNDEFVWSDADIFKSTDISYAAEREYLFKNLSQEYKTGIKWLDEVFPEGILNEHFMVWMRTSYLPTVSKVFARCEKCTIEPGTYEVQILNLYKTEIFGGEKRLTIAETSLLGTQNSFLGISYFAVGGSCIASAIVLIIAELVAPRKLGDEP